MVFLALTRECNIILKNIDMVFFLRFFVLSGYLMSSILSRESTIDSSVVKSFYIRRFKRIVPLYSIMLVILAVRFSIFARRSE